MHTPFALGLLATESAGVAVHGLALFGIAIEFILFALTLLGVALLHRHTMYVALAGLCAVLVFKLGFTHFDLLAHARHEALTLINLLGLLLGFSILAYHFEESKAPELVTRMLPEDWRGGFVLLFSVMVISSFLDNIAAAMIGGTLARVVYRGKVHTGFLAGIVAASNAGGAGSVVGDTTTTMMWIDGVAAVDVLHAFVGSAVAFLFFGFFAAKQQDALQRVVRPTEAAHPVDWRRVAVAGVILVGAIATNILFDFPAVGVWIAILLGATVCKTDWKVVSQALPGCVFLLSLVMCASLMPVEQLPAASWPTTLALGFVSAVFDNIPLTKLALDQGGYDWGMLAYAVGFGGSMIWFGSSAGVALANLYPQARSAVAYVRGGWHVPVAYVLGFFAILSVMGWHPHAPHKTASHAPAVEVANP